LEVNTEAKTKYVLPKHAFETARVYVQTKTDSLGTNARAAILRIGAREEGTFESNDYRERGSAIRCTSALLTPNGPA